MNLQLIALATLCVIGQSMPVSAQVGQPTIIGNVVVFTGADQHLDQDFATVSFWTNGFDATYSGTITEGLVKSQDGRLLLTGTLDYPHDIYDVESTVAGGTLAASGEVFGFHGFYLAEQGVLEITDGTFVAQVTGYFGGSTTDAGILITGQVTISSIAGNTFYGPIKLRNGANLTVTNPRFLLHQSRIDLDSTSTYTFPARGGVLLIPVTVDTGATFYTAYPTSTIGSVISGGRWSKTGAGTIILTSFAADRSAAVDIVGGKLRGTYENMPLSIAVSAGASAEFGLPNPGSPNRHNGQYAGVITGAGSLNKVDPNTLTLTGTSSHTGDTTVSAGSLIVNGVIDQSAFYVDAGATLGGNGTVGTTTVRNGGTLAPGNSIGTLNMAGDLTLAAGSTFRVEVDATGADRVDVGGIATIAGANLFILAENGTDTGATYAPNTTYTILTSDNAVLGQFASVTNNFAFLDASLDYETNPNAVALVLTRNDIGIGDVAASANQRGAAAALAAFDPNDPVHQALIGLSADAARQAYDSASGEIHASSPYISSQTFGSFQSLLQTGSPGTSGGAQTFPIAYGSTPGTAVASLLAIDEAETTSAMPITSAWLAPIGSRGTIEADGNAAALDWSAAGLVGGVETSTSHAGGTLAYGLGAGYVAGWANVPDRRSDLTSAGGYLGAYGNWTDGALTLKGNLAYGAEHVSTSRDVTVGAIDRTATASYWTQTVGLGAESSYAYHLTDAFTLAPVARADIKWSGHNGFTETGAGSLNASVDGASTISLDTGLGIELGYDMALATGGSLTIKGRALWQHSFGDTAPDQTVTLAGSDTPFTVAGPITSRDRLQLGTGLTYRPTETTQLSLDYTGSFSADQTSHGVTAGFKLAF